MEVNASGRFQFAVRWRDDPHRWGGLVAALSQRFLSLNSTSMEDQHLAESEG
jgi:hypothetical protein